MQNLLSTVHCKFVTFEVRNEKSSDLLLGSRRNVIQFFGKLCLNCDFPSASCSSLYSCCLLQAARNICIPYYIYSSALVKMLLDVWNNNVFSIVIKRAILCTAVKRGSSYSGEQLFSLKFLSDSSRRKGDCSSLLGCELNLSDRW